MKRGARWWMTGSASAESTSGGTGVGPGVMRKRFCILSSFLGGLLRLPAVAGGPSWEGSEAAILVNLRRPSQTLNAQSGGAPGTVPGSRPEGREHGRSGDREPRLQPDEPQAPRARAAAAVTSRMDVRGPGRGARRHARSHVARAGGDTQGGVRRERSRLVWRGPEGPRHTSRHDGRCEELRMASEHTLSAPVVSRRTSRRRRARTAGLADPNGQSRAAPRESFAYPIRRRSDARWAFRSHRSCPRSR